MTPLYKSLIILRNDAVEHGYGDLVKLYQLSLVRLADEDVMLAIKKSLERK